MDYGRFTPSPPPLPAAPAAVPQMPEGLAAASQALWQQFHREFHLEPAPALELLESVLRSRDVAEQARATLEREGLTFADGTGKPKAHPAATIHRDARAAYVSTLRVLGFPDGSPTKARRLCEVSA